MYPFLVLDLGNTRLKLHRFATAAGPAEAVAVGDPEDLALFDGLGPVAAAAMTSVAGDRALPLAARAAERLGVEVSVNPDPGLTLAVRHPETVGFDRLFAARGALTAVGGDALVVDVGTALTVDAVRGDGTFLGGAIAPGPELLAAALASGTAQLPRIEPRPGVPALGRETRDALAAGVSVGLCGAARELVRRVAEEGELGAAPVVLTGGARDFVRAALSSEGRALLEDPALVARGVLLACGGQA